MRKVIDMAGQRFGRLSVVDYQGASHWRCVCDCGSIKRVKRSSLLARSVVSCGCFGKERRQAANTTHGCSAGKDRRPEYTAWLHMKARCLNPQHESFHNYGGRGITVCDRWLDGDGAQGGFACFLEDMGVKPAGFMLERQNNSLGYFPGNCRWATREEQNSNTRANRVVLWAGRQMPLSAACTMTGANYGRVRDRLVAGWSIEDAMSTPPLPPQRRKKRGSTAVKQ